jgi:chromosome segregation ATPase
MSDPRLMVMYMTTTHPELDYRVSVLEEYVWHDLSVKVDAMNWALGQTYANTEATRQDVAGIKVELAHLEATSHADMMALKTSLDLRTSEVRRDLRTTEASIRHDMRQGFEAVDRRFNAVNEQFASVNQQFAAVNEQFNAVNEQFAAVDRRFEGVDRRFDGLEAKVDMILEEIRGGKM